VVLSLARRPHSLFLSGISPQTFFLGLFLSFHVSRNNPFNRQLNGPQIKYTRYVRGHGFEGAIYKNYFFHSGKADNPSYKK